VNRPQVSSIAGSMPSLDSANSSVRSDSGRRDPFGRSLPARLANAVSRTIHLRKGRCRMEQTCRDKGIGSRPHGHSPDLMGNVFEPWLHREAIQVLDYFLGKSMVGLEWSSGSSTKWLLQRLARLYSVESSTTWLEATRKAIEASSINTSNWECAGIGVDTAEGMAEYIATPRLVFFPQVPEGFDYVSVDGDAREMCLLEIVKHGMLRPYGVLLLDNAERQIPFSPPQHWLHVSFQNEIDETALWMRCEHGDPLCLIAQRDIDSAMREFPALVGSRYRSFLEVRKSSGINFPSANPQIGIKEEEKEKNSYEGFAAGRESATDASFSVTDQCNCPHLQYPGDSANASMFYEDSKISHDSVFFDCPPEVKDLYVSKAVAPRSKNLKSQAGEDAYIFRHFFHNVTLQHEMRFIEIGALDGVTFSNSFFFEMELHWGGVLIEAETKNYAKLERHRRGNKVIPLHLAVCESHQILTFTGTGPMAHAGASSRETTTVACLPMHEILKMARLHRVDFYSIDVEGSELKVILSHDFHSVPVHVILIEMRSVDEHLLPGCNAEIRRALWARKFCRFAKSVGHSNEVWINPHWHNSRV